MLASARGRASLLALLMLAGSTRGASAFEFADGRVQVHGFLEAQLRTLARDLDASDDYDLAQWWNVLNIEVEADILPERWGPFDLLSAFVRLEARYDCVWTRGCGMFASADTYGDRARRLPKRVSDGRRAGFRSSGAIFNRDVRRFTGLPREFLDFQFRDRPDGSRKPSPFFDVEGIDTLFDTAGPDGIFGSEDDPAPFYFDRVLRNCFFGFRRIKGREDGLGHQVLGPWNPSCRIRNIGELANKPDPLRPGDLNPVTGLGGSGNLPLRPAAENPYGYLAPKDEARGVYFPNHRLAQMLREGKFDAFDQNFRQAELAWNRGASQQDEKELKEFYLDMEFFDSRLWIRAGKQSIVWGKTELFRTTDQFNPQDLALASLPSLEESRIGLWALRGVWSFYEVGPLEDVRLELAANFDQFEPTDLGRCGEPYAALPVCDKTYGLYIHGLAALGVAGEVRPPNPWNSWKGWEVGARLEFRWGRFAIALTDFYGYNDFPYQEPLFTYSRNVDPETGRPRWGRTTGPCRDLDGDGAPDDPSCLTPENALAFHSVNQQVFRMICATSIGLQTGLDPTACGQTIFNSQNLVDASGQQVPVVVAVGSLLAGDATGLVLSGLVPGLTLNPLVPLAIDPNDGPFLSVLETNFVGLGFATAVLLQTGLQGHLTDQQEALLGCGPFYGTFCDASKADGTGGGLDLMNAEASALMQAWPGFPGAGGLDWDTRDGSVLQPGTVGFRGGPACTRYEGGRLFILPGCRGVASDPDGIIGSGDEVYQAGYDPNVDGSVDGPGFRPGPVLDPNLGWRLHPFTGQPFASEMAVLSWNTLVGLVALSAPDDPLNPALGEFDSANPLRTDGCSFAKPQFCSNVQSIFQISGMQRNSVRAGGNQRFGRRDFTWHGGSPLVLRYEKRNVLGLSMDWAEDVTKTNWGFEFTWVEDTPFTDFDAGDRIREADAFNLTISIDRPTFINFLNQNRTFFLNSQWFIQYVDGYRKGFSSNGPWNVLATLTIQTGFFRDRFNPNMTFVYDFGSNSGAWLPSVQYRYTENFSVTFGAALFAGRMESRRMPLLPSSLGSRTGRHAYRDFVENGLSLVRERDELFLRVRYTF